MKGPTNEATDGDVAQEPRRKRSPHDTSELFRAASFVPVPLPFIVTPGYLKQIGSDGLLFIVTLIAAYHQGRFRHRGGLTDGRLAIPDRDIAHLWGYSTTKPVREARAKVLAARPAFLEVCRVGSSGFPSEYQIRRLGEGDRVADPPRESVGMLIRRSWTPNEGTEIAEIAIEYVTESGFSIIPLMRDKRPYVKWKKFQDRRPTEAEIRYWVDRWPDANMGVVTGAVSNLVVVDIDGDYEGGIALLRRHGVELPPTQRVRTGSGGVHLWFSHPGVVTPTLAYVLEEEDLHIDVRGDGGYAVIPPSIHQNGTRYQFEVHVRRERPVLPESFLRLLDAQHPQNGTGAPAENFADDPTGKLPLSRSHIVAVIQDQGVVLAESGKDRYLGLCPFHPDRKPSFVVTPSRGLFRCFACKAGGNTATFVMRRTGCTFNDALRAIRRVGEQQ